MLIVTPAAKATIVNPSITHYEDTLDLGEGLSLRVVSDVSYDPYEDLNIFDYQIFNNSGDTIIEAKYTGEDWVFGHGENLIWNTEIFDSPNLNEDFIRFYGNSLLNGNNEEFLTGSRQRDTWGIRQAEFKGHNGIYTLDVLTPEIVPEPATICMLITGFLILSRKKNL
jgi:hypothetical protein